MMDEPTVFLVELTPEQMRTFWIVTEDWQETQLMWDDDCPERVWPRSPQSLYSLQSAVENARPIFD